MTLADPIVNVEPVGCEVPDAFAAVFQPVNEYPVRARLPVLSSTVTVAPCWYDVDSPADLSRLRKELKSDLEGFPRRTHEFLESLIHRKEE